MLGDPEKRRSRDPERTRERLLKAGFQEVYRSGFQSASIDTILAAANVTKGADVSASPPQRDTVYPGRSKREDTFESTAEDAFFEPFGTSLFPVTRVDAASLIRALQQLADIPIRRAPRIAFKVEGRILFLELT